VPARVDGRGTGFDALGQHVVQVHVIALHAHVARSEPANLEQIVDETGEATELPLHHGQRPAQLFLAVRAALDDVQAIAQRRERTAQLVRQRRAEAFQARVRAIERRAREMLAPRRRAILEDDGHLPRLRIAHPECVAMEFAIEGARHVVEAGRFAGLRDMRIQLEPVWLVIRPQPAHGFSHRVVQAGRLGEARADGQEAVVQPGRLAANLDDAGREIARVEQAARPLATCIGRGKRVDVRMPASGCKHAHLQGRRC
jgi:hypothetical protein